MMDRDFYTCYAFAEELRKAGDRHYGVLVDWHTAGEGRDNYQRLAYSHFGDWERGAALYFDFKFAAREFRDGGSEAVAVALWERMSDKLHSVRKVRAGGRSEFAGCVTLFELFVESVLPRLGVRDSAKSRESVGFMYLCLLAWELAGAVAEVETYERLVEVFGESRVGWAESWEESSDVDLYFDGLPVSVKNYRGFGERTFNKYRNKNDAPVMYLSRDLEWAVPRSVDPVRVLDGGFKIWRYRQGDADSFLAAVESVGGLPVDSGFVPDFGCLGSSPIDDCLSVPRRSIYRVGSPKYVAVMPTPDDELFARAML